MDIEFTLLEEGEQLLCKGHIDPDVVIIEAAKYLRRIAGNDFDDSIEALTAKDISHTIARCVPLSPRDPDYGYYSWMLYTDQKPGRGAFKATIINL